VALEERFYTQLRLSPDGTHVAVYEPDGDRDLWIFDLNRPAGPITKLTFGPDRDQMPVWSPDGRQVFFTTQENKVSWIPADRSSDAVVLFTGPAGHRVFPLSITPDAQTLIVLYEQTRGNADLAMVSVGLNSRLTPLLAASSYHERDGRLSPDGRWLAYQSNESGQDQILVRPFPNVTAFRRVVSAGYGQQPMWSQDSRELFYQKADGQVMTVPFKTTPTFTADSPVPVITAQTLRTLGLGSTYEVSPDGRRFLMIKTPERDIRSLTVVQNWDVEVNATIAKAARK
jgi:serine/threonine-protein kinase